MKGTSPFLVGHRACRSILSFPTAVGTVPELVLLRYDYSNFDSILNRFWPKITISNRFVSRRQLTLSLCLPVYPSKLDNNQLDNGNGREEVDCPPPASRSITSDGLSTWPVFKAADVPVCSVV